jgi:hypothetical protein
VIGETVTLVRRVETGRDSHGNTIWADSEIPVDGCAVWPTGSTERIQGQDQTSTRVTVMFPYGTTVLHTDKAKVRGLLYEVTGLPSSWSSPFTTTRAGVEVQMTHVTG